MAQSVVLRVRRPGDRADALLDRLAGRLNLPDRPRVGEDGRVEVSLGEISPRAANGREWLGHFLRHHDPEAETYVEVIQPTE